MGDYKKQKRRTKNNLIKNSNTAKARKKREKIRRNIETNLAIQAYYDDRRRQAKLGIDYCADDE